MQKCEYRNITAVVLAAPLPDTEHGRLPQPSQSWQPAPEETVAMTIRLQSRISTVLRTGATAPQQQMQTWANPSDKGGDTEARQLRSDSHHYWEENKVTNTPEASLSPSCPHPSWLILEEAPGTPQSEQHCVWLLKQPENFRGLENPMTDHILPQEWCPETEVTWSQRRGPPTQGIQRIFHHPAEIQEA